MSNTFVAWIGVFSALITIAGAVFSLQAWLKALSVRRAQQAEERRRAQPIQLIVVNEENQAEYPLRYQPRRDQMSRAEVQGILGLYYGEGRYKPPPLEALLASGALDRVLNASSDELRIPVPSDFFRNVAGGEVT